jgi:hypothetical protein
MAWRYFEAQRLQRPHTMNIAVLGPAAERLTLPPEQNPKETPDRNECCICHDGLDETASG